QFRKSSWAWGWSLLRSPSPQPSPPGEGTRWHGAGKFGRCGCSPRFVVFRFGCTRQPSSVVSPKHGRIFLPLLGGGGRGEGERDTAVLAASTLELGARRPPEGPHDFQPFIISSL